MKYFYLLLPALLAQAGLSCQGQTNDFTPSDSLFPKVDRKAREAVTETGFPGIAIGIVAGGETVYAEGFGFADLEKKIPADAETVYQLGSVTKTVTGHLLARLVVEGQLSLDDPVDKYLPERVSLKDAADRPVTVLQVATHSAELPRYPANLQRVDPDPIRGFSKEELYAGLGMVEIDTLAGHRYAYSNFGYGFLGTLMENTSGKSLNRLMHRYLFDSLEMDHSSLILTEKAAERLAVPYLEVDPLTSTEPWDMGALSGAGNLFSSVADLTKLMRHLLRSSPANRLQQQPYLKINDHWSYGLGCFLIDSESKNTEIVYHGGDIDGYASYLALYPEFDFGIVILTNYGEGRMFGPVAEEIASAAFEVLSGGEED